MACKQILAGTAALLTSLATLLSAQTVELNARLDDGGEIYLNGEQVVMPKRTEVGKEDKDTTVATVNVEQGTNTLAFKVVNGAWGGQLFASMILPSGDTVRTDETWKSTLLPVPDNWNATDFDAAKWDGVSDLGNIETAPGFENSGTAWANLYYHGARRIWGLPKVHFRREFQSDGGSAVFKIRGNGFTHTVYLNGREIGSGSEFGQCDDGTDCSDYRACRCLDVPVVEYTCNTTAGTNVVAVVAEDVRLNGNGPLMKCALFHSDNKKREASGPGWNVHSKEIDGWLEAGLDVSGWGESGIVDAYDRSADQGDGLGTVMWMWPTTVYFRKSFEWDGSVDPNVSMGTRAQRKSPRFASEAIVRTELYTLNGMRISTSGTRLRCLPKMLIEKRIYAKGGAQTRLVRTK